MKMVRLDTTLFPMNEYEKRRAIELGFDEIVEIDGNTPEEIIAAAHDAEVVQVVSNYITAEVIDHLNKCKLIMRRGTGCDKIDIKRATEKGIMVANLPVFATEDVADHAMLLMLAAARGLKPLMDSMVKHDWMEEKVRNRAQATRITGKTLGLLGFGNIGKKIAVRAKAFGMRVIDYHPHVRPEVEAQYGVEPVSLDVLIRESDFLIICCPKTPDTVNLIGKEEFRIMKPTAFVINVGRGDVTDEAAFADAVRNHIIAGGATDVFQHVNIFKPEDQSKDIYYADIENFICTPHVAADNRDTWIESVDKAMEQISLVVHGYFPTSWKNPELRERLSDRYQDAPGV